jgi:hypothetical protein
MSKEILDDSFIDNFGESEISWDELFTLRKFIHNDEARTLRNLLTESGIKSRTIFSDAKLGSIIQGDFNSHKYELMALHEDLEAAQVVLKEQAQSMLAEIDPSHYLFSFSNDELRDVLVKDSEWNELDVVLAESLLEQRGAPADKKIIEQGQKNHINELAQPESGQIGWIIAGYILVLGGTFVGVVIGYFIWKAKNKLPDGSKVPAYTRQIRLHAKIIFIVGCFIFTTAVLLGLSLDIAVFSTIGGL